MMLQYKVLSKNELFCWRGMVRGKCVLGGVVVVGGAFSQESYSVPLFKHINSSVLLTGKSFLSATSLNCNLGNLGVGI